MAVMIDGAFSFSKPSDIGWGRSIPRGPKPDFTSGVRRDLMSGFWAYGFIVEGGCHYGASDGPFSSWDEAKARVAGVIARVRRQREAMA